MMTQTSLTTVTNSIATKLDASAVSTFGGTLIDDADAAAARTTLGLGTAAVATTSDFATAAQGTTADNALPKAGGTMAGDIAMGSNKITGLGTPSAAGDATTKQYVDTQISASGRNCNQCFWYQPNQCY